MVDQRIKKILDTLDQEIEEERARSVFSREEVEKYLKDPVAFCKEEIGFTPSPDQEKFLILMSDLNCRDVMVSGARGSGKSWTVGALALWSAVFLPPLYEDEYLISVLAGSNFQAVKVFEHMDKFIQKSNRISGMVVRKTQNEMEFSNGAVVLIYKTSEKYARSRHPDLLILDEVVLADQEEGGKVVAAALDSVSAARHGRRVMLSTPSYMRGLFGEYWYKAEEYGFTRFRWTAEPGKRLWMDSTRENTEWERAKKTSQNFDTEWLAIPHSDVRYLHMEEDVDKATTLIDPNSVAELHEKGYTFIMGADFGYDPAPTVLTSAAMNEEDGVVYILEQEAIERGSVEFVVAQALDMGSRYGASELYGDLFGKIYMDSMNDVGIQTHEVSFSKSKELMITKLNSCLRQGLMKIDANCKEGIKQMKNMHRDSHGKVVKGCDDHYDSILCCFIPLLESGKITFGWLDGI